MRAFLYVWLGDHMDENLRSTRLQMTASAARRQVESRTRDRRECARRAKRGTRESILCIRLPFSSNGAPAKAGLYMCGWGTTWMRTSVRLTPPDARAAPATGGRTPQRSAGARRAKRGTRGVNPAFQSAVYLKRSTPHKRELSTSHKRAFLCGLRFPGVEPSFD